MNLQLIPKLEKDFDTDHTNELKALGINVIDQLSLEQNVAAEVDEAVKKLNRKQKLQILRREVKESKLELIKLKNKDADFEHRLLGMRQRVTDPRQFIAVEKSYNENREQVKTICKRKEYVEEKLNAASEDLSVLDDVDLNLEEGEMVDEDDDENSLISSINKDALIKEGKMTPFGTLLNSFDSSENVSTVKPSGTNTYRSKDFEHSTLSEVKNNNSDHRTVKAGKTTSYLHSSNSVMTSHSTRPAKGHKLKENKTMSTFEKYLQDQIDKQKSCSKESSANLKRKSSSNSVYGNFKKKRIKPKEFNILTDEKLEGKNTHMGDKSSPLKKRILKPKKHWKEKNIGSITSQSEADQFKTPAGVLSERVAFITSDDEKHGSDSDYVPSEEEYLSEEESKRVGQSTSVVTKSERRTTKTEGKAKRSKKVPDDGYIENYAKRIEQWKKERLNEKHRKIMEGEDVDSDEDDEFERFDGDYKIPLTLWNKLYKYQRTCVKWLWELHCQRCGGILGDEMGLGKTIMIISYLVGLSYSGLLDRDRKHKGLGPVLIVAPATVLHQWVREFHKWWPPFRVAVLHESGVFRGKKSALIHNVHTHDGILITSYRGVVDHIKVLLNYHWHYVILDEGHKIRNPEAQITVAVKRFETAHRLILSGSPIQNGLKELWSLFDFIFPGKLGSLPVFLQQFAVPITQGGYANASKLEVQTAFRCATVLRDTINPYLLRRMKIDVKNHLSLPDKSEQVLFCGLSDHQRAIYRRYIDGNEVKNIMNGRLKVFVGLINLRKICNHPDLYDGGPKHLVHEDISDLQPEFQYGWWKKSGKMVVLQSILKLWKKQDHKVLLFTQSRQMLCILEKYLRDETYQYLKMDGGTSVGSRQTIIDQFNGDPSIFVFLLTTRVGGLGTNLTGADRVLIFDPDWNPSTDTQARERAWRIGQTKHVTIYRLLTAGTIEEKIYHRQIFKQFLTNRVLKDPKQQRFFKTNDLFELFTLNEGEKEKTESAAIFAGTGSEIIVKGKEKIKNRNGKEKREKVNILEEENSVEKNDLILEANSKCIDQNIPDDVGSNHSDDKEEFETRSKSPCNNNIDKLGETESLINHISENIELDEKIKNNNRDDDNNSISETDVNCLSENPEHDNIENDVTERLTLVEEPLRVLSENGDLNDDDKKEKMRALAKLLSKKITENKKERKETNRTDDGESPSKRKESKKKKKNKKDSEKRRKKLEGEMIDNLVKKRKYKYSEDTNVDESKLNKKQDDFVLQKLFKSSGVHTALSHDVILNAGDPDYLLLESEADKVAKEALKQVRLSRAQFLRTRKSDVDRGKKSKRIPKFGSKRSQLVAVDPRDLKRTNSQSETKSTPKMFNGCVNDEDEENLSKESLEKAPSDVTSAPIDEGASSGVLSSAQLLKRMRERNRIKSVNPVNDGSSFDEAMSYDPDYPSTANLEIPVGEIDPEVQKHVDLLSDIRNFVAFQATTDGRASTEEVVQRFKDKVPTNQNHIFKALLNQICILVRDGSGQGFWHIKGEFR